MYIIYTIYRYHIIQGYLYHTHYIRDIIITRLLAKTKKSLHTVCLSTMTIGSVDQQRNSLRKAWRRLATEYAGVISYRTTTWSDTKDVNQAQNAPSLTAVTIATVNYQKRIDRWNLGRPMQVNGAFYSIEKSRGITIYNTLCMFILYIVCIHIIHSCQSSGLTVKSQICGVPYVSDSPRTEWVSKTPSRPLGLVFAH